MFKKHENSYSHLATSGHNAFCMLVNRALIFFIFTISVFSLKLEAFGLLGLVCSFFFKGKAFLKLDFSSHGQGRHSLAETR